MVKVEDCIPAFSQEFQSIPVYLVDSELCFINKLLRLLNGHASPVCFRFPVLFSMDSFPDNRRMPNRNNDFFAADPCFVFYTMGTEQVNNGLFLEICCHIFLLAAKGQILIRGVLCGPISGHCLTCLSTAPPGNAFPLGLAFEPGLADKVLLHALPLGDFGGALRGDPNQ